MKQKAQKIIIDVLKKGTSVNIFVDGTIRNHEGDSLLHVAIYYNLFDLFKQLLKKNAEISLRDDNGRGRTPLICAALFNHHDMVKILLEAGADPNIRDDSNQTALHWVAQNGGKESAQLLIDYGADMYALDGDGETPAEQHYFGRKQNDIASVLIKNGLNPGTCNTSYLNLLQGSIKCKDNDAVTEILKQDFYLTTEQFNECLDFASEHADMVKRVAPNGKQLTKGSTDFHYPLFETAKKTMDVEAVALLIELGADVEKAISKIDNFTGSSLSVSLTDSPVFIAKRLIRPLKAYGLNVKIKDRYEAFSSALPKILLIAVHTVLIILPTLYLCFTTSWLYFFIPGVCGGLIYLMIPSQPATGDIQGMEIVVIGFTLDLFLLITMPLLAFWKYNT